MGRAARTPPLIGVNLLWLVPGVVGGSEHAVTALLRSLCELPDPGVRLRAFVLEGFAGAHPDLAEGLPLDVLPLDGGRKGLRVLAEQTWLAVRTHRHGCALVHHAGGVAPLVRGAPSVLTIHDLQPLVLPDNFSATKRMYLRTMLGRSARSSVMVSCPSRFTAEQVCDRLGADPARVAVVPWSVAPPGPAPSAEVADGVLGRHGLARPFVLYPAITHPHKNHAVLLDALERVPTGTGPDLVLTASDGTPDAGLLRRWETPPLAGRVHWLGRVTAIELDVLYRRAAALVFPSRFEGFGLPVIEAAARGTQVVVASGTALDEVAPVSAVRVDPDDVAGWARAFVRAVDDPLWGSDSDLASIDTIARFAPERTAAAMIEVYRRALAARPSRNQHGTSRL